MIGAGSRSRIVTGMPSSARMNAATDPTGPPPTITTRSCLRFMARAFWRAAGRGASHGLCLARGWAGSNAMAGAMSYVRLVSYVAREVFEVARGAVRGWIEDRAASMGAAIAYYTVFSVAPILLLVIAIAGLAFGDQAAQGALVGSLSDVIGTESAEALQALIKQASLGSAGPIATGISLATMAIAATAVLAELQSALKVVWRVESRPGRKIIIAIKYRLLCLAIILGCGVLLGASLATSTAINILSGYLTEVHAALPYILGVVNVCITLAMTTVLFGMTFKILPDAPIEWRDVWSGAAFTAVLFTVGK